MKRKNPEEILNKISAKKKPIYENCSVYTIDGLLLFRCNRKKINWYLSKDLAETIEPKAGEDISIRLKFVARGKSHSDTLWGTEDRANQCCVCGALDHLNLHHVFPYVYRKWCPELIKSHTHHDILPLCTLCHAKYEIHAQKLKDAIVKMFNMPLESRGYIEYPDNRSIIKAANALKWHSEKIPEERKNILFERIHKFFEARKMSDKMSRKEMIEQAMILPTLERSENFLEHGEYVVKQILSITRKDNSECQCVHEICPCKNGKTSEIENQIIEKNHEEEKEGGKINKKKVKVKKKDTEKNNEKDKVDDEDDDESPILLHFSPSKTETDDPNGSTIEKDLEILNDYVNRCCGELCHCQCQRLPMPDQITKEIYKPEGFELKSIPIDHKVPSSPKKKASEELEELVSKDINRNSDQNEIDDYSPTSVSSHSEESKKSDKELTPLEKEKQKNPMLERFIKMWRKHFLIYTKPKFLSISWQVSNSVYSD